jgi:DNA-binding transcriptional MerR regulator
VLTIGNVARQVGVQPSAIRYYEARGILNPTPRRANGYRVYSDQTVKLLRFLKRAQALGITLKELKPLLTLASQGQQPCSNVKALARNHLRDIERKMRELQALRNELRTLLRRNGGQTDTDQVCPMIEGKGRENRPRGFASRSVSRSAS